jgi:hypothetical protein
MKAAPSLTLVLALMTSAVLPISRAIAREAVRLAAEPAVAGLASHYPAHFTDAQNGGTFLLDKKVRLQSDGFCTLREDSRARMDWHE